jgi:glycosyltransferase involved in cell wall biosynthesis
MFKLSIITINYNNLGGLKRTVNSVINQTYKDFEYIVIDGASTDGSAEYLKNQSSKMHYFISEKDTGVYNAMNKGIKVANGEYLLFLNSGDHLNDSFTLEKIKSHLSNEDIIYFNVKIVEDAISYASENPQEFSFFYLHNNLPCHQSTFIKKTVFNKVGTYDENLKIVADWKLLILAILKHNCSYRKVDAVFSTFYKDGMSSTEKNKTLMQQERDQVLQAEFPVLLNDLKEQYKLLRIIRNLKKSRKIQLLIRLGLIDKF